MIPRAENVIFVSHGIFFLLKKENKNYLDIGLDR